MPKLNKFDKAISILTIESLVKIHATEFAQIEQELRLNCPCSYKEKQFLIQTIPGY